MKWTGGLKFEGTSAFGHPIATDGAKGHGGNEEGYKPIELMLFAVASCTGVDVVLILKRQRQQLKSLEVEVIGHQNDKYPKPFHTVEVKYVATGVDLDPEKLALAIEMSESKYCVVSQTIENETKMVSTYEIRSA